jgi:type IV pilus assembly protein PilQ
MRIIYFTYLLIITSVIPTLTFGQQTGSDIEKKLIELSKTETNLLNKVDISVSDISLQEFLRSIALSNTINLNIDPGLTQIITNNFNNVTVIDILVFLTKEYDLNLEITGNIISIEARKIVEEPKKKIVKIKTIVQYDAVKDIISLDIRSDSLINVIKEINSKTKKNLVCKKGLEYVLVSTFISEMPFESAVDKFGFSNNFTVTKTDDNYYLIEEKEDDIKTGNINKDPKNKKPNRDILNTVIEVKDFNHISVTGEDVPIKDLLLEVTEKLDVNYFLISDIQGNKTLNVKNIDFESFLGFLFEGSKYTFKKIKDNYILGEGTVGNLQYYTIIELQYRTVVKVMEVIPEDLKKDLEIKEFVELNSLLISGNPVSVEKLEYFIKSIDKVVPLVFIEVIIVDITNNYSISTGISAGLGDSIPQTSGSIFPYLDMSLNSGSINNLIEKVNGLNWINLGQVTPSFYLNLQLQENNGNLKIRSTPKLATLNGHQAIFTSGETKYYKEEKDNLIGYQTPSLVKTYTWKAINADMSITITPVVSGDEQITLDIDVKQSEFTPREFDDAPPGSVTRQFTSLIRVKNGDMIMLGGLERNSSSNTGTGIPILSRIPVLKWIFSKRTNTKTKTKLNIFVRPTIVY